MTLEALHRFVHTLPAVTEDFPFGPEVLAFRVGGKIFALMSIEALPLRINLKCDPERAVALRAEYEDIIPGYHMNKVHWNTVGLEGDLPSSLIRELISHSYDLIFASLKKADRERIRGSGA